MTDNSVTTKRGPVVKCEACGYIHEVKSWIQPREPGYIDLVEEGKVVASGKIFAQCPLKQGIFILMDITPDLEVLP